MRWVDIAVIPPGEGQGFQQLCTAPTGTGWQTAQDFVESQLDFTLNVNTVYAATLLGVL